MLLIGLPISFFMRTKSRPPHYRFDLSVHDLRKPRSTYASRSREYIPGEKRSDVRETFSGRLLCVREKVGYNDDDDDDDLRRMRS